MDTNNFLSRCSLKLAYICLKSTSSELFCFSPLRLKPPERTFFFFYQNLRRVLFLGFSQIKPAGIILLLNYGLSAAIPFRDTSRNEYNFTLRLFACGIVFSGEIFFALFGFEVELNNLPFEKCNWILLLYWFSCRFRTRDGWVCFVTVECNLWFQEDQSNYTRQFALTTQFC